MIITKVETFPLSIPFEPGPRAAASAWGAEGLAAADSLLVKVTTDQGLEGWGETFGFRAVSSAKLAIDELIGPLCVGRDATQIGTLMLEVQKKLHVFGRSGPNRSSSIAAFSALSRLTPIRKRASPMRRDFCDACR